MASASVSASAHVPVWVAALFPGGIADAAPLRWGFTNESWAVSLRDGRRLAVTRLADSVESGAAGRRVGAIRPRLLAAGLPLAVPVAPHEDRAWPADVRVTAFIDGVSGASLLEEPGGPDAVGRVCGETSRRIAAIDGSGVGLPDLWAHPNRLVAAVRTWAADVVQDLAGSDRVDLWTAVEEMAPRFPGRPAVVAHGDLVPVNVLARDGRLVGLLDLDEIRLADPLFDAAWFDHVVAFHHPAEHSAARAGFAAGVALDLDGVDAVSIMRALTVARVLEILGGPAGGGPGRNAWLGHLRFALRPGRLAG